MTTMSTTFLPWIEENQENYLGHGDLPTLSKTQTSNSRRTRKRKDEQLVDGSMSTEKLAQLAPVCKKHFFNSRIVEG